MHVLLFLEAVGNIPIHRLNPAVHPPSPAHLHQLMLKPASGSLAPIPIVPLSDSAKLDLVVCFAGA